MGAERRAARQRLIAAFPTDAQTLLLRASLIRGGFDRGLALEIAGLEPILPLPGLLLDQLVGPWIEPYRTKRLRVSPLLEDAAEDVLTSAECRAVHRRIADAMFRARSISVLDAPAAMHHALRSEEGGFVFAFAHSVITCPVEVLDFLAPFLGELMAFATDTPIFPQDLAVSAMLRLAQLLVLLPYGTPGNARAAWDAFERERFHVTGPELIEGFTLSKLLLHPRTGELFSDWLEILLRFDRLLGISPQLATANSNFKSVAGDPHVSGVLFGAQLGNVRTVARFKEILERLDNEEPATRDRVLSSFQPGRGDISILVNHGWLKESRIDTFDWEAAARDYAACADLAINWGNAMLATRCAIAQAICLDENGDDAERGTCLPRASRGQIRLRHRNFARPGQDPLAQARSCRGAPAADSGCRSRRPGHYRTGLYRSRGWHKRRDARRLGSRPAMVRTCSGGGFDARQDAFGARDGDRAARRYRPCRLLRGPA
ncbi:hypothetical protein NKH63_26395 [Mesorhizobium sp. M0960]|uniref:hypothetical protein n=1 Tax=Mesorhizobium sp. M0960 TaxID=2957035 RepID=UPI00333BDFD1